MSNDIATLDTNTSFEQLALITGQNISEGPKSFLPRLKINRDFEDDSGNQTPPGTYSLTIDDEPVFAKTAKFRPFMNAFQYSVFDPESKKYTNRTILFKSWSDEAIDMLGGTRCGKLSAKQKNNLTAEQVVQQKNTKCYRNVYGTVSMEATTSSGKKLTVTNEPCLWRVTGSAFIPVGDALQVITANKRPYFSSELELEPPKREKNGSTIYYVPVIKTNSKVISYNEEDFALLKKFQQTIDFENGPVIEAYKKARGFIEQQDIMEEVLEAGFIDFNDDLPESMQ